MISFQLATTRQPVYLQPMAKRFFLLLLLPALVIVADCGSDAPDDHQVSQDGTRHLEGLKDPDVNCVTCHGEDLKGDDGPSCYECHNKKW